MQEENNLDGKSVDPTILKVPASGGKSFTEIQRDTDKVVERKSHRFVEYLAKDIVDIRAMLKIFVAKPTKENMRPIFDRVHNLRGQGTLFDYPLVTSIGGHFCNYIDSLPENEAPRGEVVLTFINSLQLIQSAQIKGEGSAEMQTIERNMRLMVQKLSNKNTKS